MKINKLILGLIGLFIIAQVVGIFTGITILNDISKNPYVSSLVVASDANEPINALYFMGYVLIGAVVMIIVIRKAPFFPIIFRAVEFMLIATSSSVVFYSALRTIMGYEESTIIGIVIALIFSGIRLVYPQLKNAAAILATAGVGVVFGVSMGIIPIIIFLILLAIYDYIAVFTTKHMVEMANFVVKKNLALTITSTIPGERFGEKEQRVDLGTGDIIAPIMLEIATLGYSPNATLFVFVGGVISLSLFLILVWKKKMVLPALPPIVAGMLVSLFIGFLLGFYS